MDAMLRMHEVVRAPGRFSPSSEAAPGRVTKRRQETKVAQPNRKIRVGVNGYGVIGKRVVDAVARQEDMELRGVVDVVTDWRTLSALKRAGLLRKARGTLLRRATDPWESHESGIMNTLVPEAEIPSHQGPDAQTVDPALDVVAIRTDAALGIGASAW